MVTNEIRKRSHGYQQEDLIESTVCGRILQTRLHSCVLDLFELSCQPYEYGNIVSTTAKYQLTTITQTAFFVRCGIIDITPV